MKAVMVAVPEGRTVNRIRGDIHWARTRGDIHRTTIHRSSNANACIEALGIGGGCCGGEGRSCQCGNSQGADCVVLQGRCKLREYVG